MSSLAPPHSIETAVSLGASDKSPFPAEEKVNSIDGLPDHTIMDDVAQGYSGLKDLKSGGITTPLGSPKTATPTAGSPLTPTDSTLTPTGTTQPPLTRSKSDLGSGISHRNFLNDFPKGMGLGPDAEIWTKYNDFTTQYDKEMLDTYNGGMDNLLIFAALFSAIVTAFLMESLDLLSPDTSGATLDALTTVSAQLSALGTSSSIMPASYQETQFTIPTSALYVNALWIFSLSISLSASVLAMLVKQWLRVYDTDWPSVPHDRANFRQFRYHGLVKWQVPGIANSLPLLLQISVALFLAGFVVYLWGTSPGLQWLLLILFISGGIGYVGLGVAAFAG
ncbi:hypothetical protein CALCODRAFT_485735 [Calocera cornea HHB12733]|uniref:DUF6535 domain-containing protein n=1 Tax=Calocera cornea HHB12733 TaxID=1353952 RepID=A0A165E6S6_9BASI|nr:hypothetical protein CALCODRAFT_485735 [Calocera cornea HHB12733]